MNLNRFLKKFLVLWLSVSLTATFFPYGASSWAELQDVVDTKDQQEVLLYRGDLVGLKVYSLTRVSISQSGIVDIANADVNQILLIGQGEGETQIFIWDELGKRSIVARVFAEDLDLVMAKIENLIKATKIQGVTLEKNKYDRKIIASGRFTKDDKERLESEVFDKFPNLVTNMTREEGDLIQIDVQISELNTTLQKALGVEWNDSFDFPETLPAATGDWKNLFKIGDFNRTTALIATINALIQEGKGRILSKPSIVVTNGEEATFLVGGEIPIRTTTTSVGGSSVQENVTFKQYGIDLKVKPQIIDNKINVELHVGVRDIDAANAVGDDVAFSTRTATTKLMLNDTQTVVLAGLIKHSESEVVKRVPLLGSIPVIGLLFRSKTLPATNQELELVISLTPRILRQKILEQEYQQPQEQAALSEEEQTAEAEDAESPSAEMEQSLAEEAPVGTKAEAAENEIPQETAESQTETTTDNAAAAVKTEGVDTETPEVAGEAPMDQKSKQAVTDYVQSIQKRIAQNISFPYEAKEKGWKGTVVLNLKILSDGNLSEASVKESSGQSIFDKDAVNTAQILAPFDPFPAEIPLEELSVTIPIVYSQEAILEFNGQEPEKK